MPGMDMPQGKAEPSKVPSHSIVKITPDRQQLIGVRTGKVERDKLLMSIRAVGIIEPDQTRLARIHSRTSGWATKVYANFVGQNVEKGDPLLEIYSPDLLATQQEYLIARSSQEVPGMYADLKIEHDMGAGLLVPDSAVLRTGERAIAFRSLPEGRFEPVEVKLGSRFGERLEVLGGLEAADEVVTSAGFLIDSESRMKATASGGGGHKHGQ